MSAGFWLAETLLHPKLALCQVANTSDATAEPNAYRGLRVGVHSNGHLKAKVSAPCLDAEGLSGPLHHAV